MKKIGFYCILASGHFNVSVSIAQVILNNNKDIEIWFIVDEEWEGKLSKMDSRFKFGLIQYNSNEQKGRLTTMIEEFKSYLKISPVERSIETWIKFMKDETYFEIDKLVAEKIRELKLDFLLCDQVFHLPAMHTGVPFAFVESACPAVFAIDGFPKMGSDAGLNEIEKIMLHDRQMSEARELSRTVLKRIFKERNVEIPEGCRIDQPLCDHFSIYVHPKELDYYDDEMKSKYKLWQIDTPVHLQRIPPPFELPEDFKKLPGQIIYVSLGSLFSVFVEHLQRMVDYLDKLPYKYIVSKGPNGDKLKFPSKKFIGENFVNQLAVLQVCDLMIAHGGNNTLGECFYFGVKSVILPVLSDQINNAKRITETGYGYSLDLVNYSEQELGNTLNEALNNSELDRKLKKISERIRKEDRISAVSAKIVKYIKQL